MKFLRMVSLLVFITLFVGCSASLDIAQITTPDMSSSQSEAIPPLPIQSDIDIFAEHYWRKPNGSGKMISLFTQQLDEQYTLYKYDNDTPFGDFMIYDKNTNSMMPIQFDSSVKGTIAVDIEDILYSESNSMLYFYNHTGHVPFQPNDFPHRLIYDIKNNVWSKEYFQLNDINSYYNIGFNYLAKGVFQSINQTEDMISIYFDIDEINADNYFPKIDFYYDEYNCIVTLHFLGIKCSNFDVIKLIENIPGISNVVGESVPTGTEISFSIDKDYCLFGEVVSGYNSSDTDHLSFWTKKRS